MIKFYKKYEDLFEAVGGFLFILGIFYMLYVSLWIFCPC